MIEEYWNEMFGEFKTGPRSFSLSGFPEPLMSPDFERRNIIGNKPEGTCASFLLCGFQPEKFNFHITTEPLQNVLKDPTFWNYQKTCVPDTVIFMKRLLPFLAVLNRPHYYFSIVEKGETVATAFGGEGETTCFLFNLKVREPFQGKGLARKLLTGARSHFENKKCFYWTVHPSFTLGATYVEGYHLRA